MPELPEVETIKRDMERHLKGSTLKGIEVFYEPLLKKSGLTPESLNRLIDKRLFRIERQGKYLLFNFEENFLVFHLGLTGALIFNGKVDSQNLKHLILKLDFEKGKLFFFDVRKFGRAFLLKKEELKEFFKDLGKDALEISLSDFSTLLKAHHLRLKTLLLNQRLLSGLGNIYADELLFRTNLHPEKFSDTLSDEEIQKLYENMKALLKEAITLRGSSIRDYVDGEGKRGAFQERHLVYGKRGKPCPNCGEPLQYKVIAQRGTTFCPRCQK